MTMACCGAILVGITPVSDLARCVACGESVLGPKGELPAVSLIWIKPWATQAGVADAGTLA